MLNFRIQAISGVRILKNILGVNLVTEIKIRRGKMKWHRGNVLEKNMVTIWGKTISIKQWNELSLYMGQILNPWGQFMGYISRFRGKD